MFSPSLQPVGILAVGLQPERVQPDEIAQAFSSAQTRSIIGGLGQRGHGRRAVVVNTWNNTGSFYVRVNGRPARSTPGSQFTLSVLEGCDDRAPA